MNTVDRIPSNPPAARAVSAKASPARYHWPRADGGRHGKVTGVLLGVDSEKVYLPALNLLARLDFADVSMKLVYSVNGMSCIPLPNPEAEVAYERVMENIGLDALNAAMDDVAQVRMRAKMSIVFGQTAECLIEKATEDAADLIAICATRYGRWSGSYLDSLSSALIQGAPCSLLVAKEHEEHRAIEPGTAVLALDGSAGGRAVVEKFISLRPVGIRKVHVVVAFEVDDEAASIVARNPAALGGDVDRWLDDRFSEVCKSAVQELAGAGYEATYEVFEEEPNEAIRRAMESRNADILVIGTGHLNGGANHIGKVALHQIGYERYPVLMVKTAA